MLRKIPAKPSRTVNGEAHAGEELKDQQDPKLDSSGTGFGKTAALRKA